jgi:hypothetical protein
MKSHPTEDLARHFCVARLAAMSARLADENLVSTAMMRIQDVQRKSPLRIAVLMRRAAL